MGEKVRLLLIVEITWMRKVVMAWILMFIPIKSVVG